MVRERLNKRLSKRKSVMKYLQFWFQRGKFFKPEFFAAENHLYFGIVFLCSNSFTL